MPKDSSPPGSGPSGFAPFCCRLVRDTAEAAALSASGEIDLATKDRLYEALAPLLEDERPLLLDLSQVTFIDCAGLRVLQTAHRAHRRFAVVAPSIAVARLLDLAGANVTVFASDHEAIHRLRRPVSEEI